MSVLEIVILSLMAVGLITFIVVGTIKTLRKGKKPQKDDGEIIE